MSGMQNAKPTADEYAEIQRRIAIARGVIHDYSGPRCICMQTGCRAGPGCPHYSQHCKAHIAHEGRR